MGITMYPELPKGGTKPAFVKLDAWTRIVKLDKVDEMAEQYRKYGVEPQFLGAGFVEWVTSVVWVSTLDETRVVTLPMRWTTTLN